MNYNNSTITNINNYANMDDLDIAVDIFDIAAQLAVNPGMTANLIAALKWISNNRSGKWCSDLSARLVAAHPSVWSVVFQTWS